MAMYYNGIPVGPEPWFRVKSVNGDGTATVTIGGDTVNSWDLAAKEPDDDTYAPVEVGYTIRQIGDTAQDEVHVSVRESGLGRWYGGIDNSLQMSPERARQVRDELTRTLDDLDRIRQAARDLKAEQPTRSVWDM